VVRRLSAISIDVDEGQIFNNSTSAFDITPTTAEYVVTVETDLTGITYNVSADGRLQLSGDQYIFARDGEPSAHITSDPVFPEPAPDVDLDFKECAGLVNVEFVDENDNPVAIDGGRILAHREATGNPGVFRLQARDFALPGGTTEEWVAVRGDSSLYRVDTFIITTSGSDTFSDFVTFETLCQHFVTVGCDELVELQCVIPSDGSGGGPPDPADLGRIIGEADMLCEDEIDDPVGSQRRYTRMTADLGPFNNFRFDWIASDPSSGPFELENLLQSDAVDPAQGYRVSGQMAFGSGETYQTFRTPFLCRGLNPCVFVEGGLTTDLTDTFVMDPGYVEGDLLLCGPQETQPGAAFLRDIARVSDPICNLDIDGFPQNGSCANFNFGSYLRGFGLNQIAAGATLGADLGNSFANFAGSYNPSGSNAHPERDSFIGNYRFPLGGLEQENSHWNVSRWIYQLQDTDDPLDEANYQDTKIRILRTETDRTNIEIVPKVDYVRNHKYCVSEVSFLFSSAASDFFDPRLTGFGNGSGTFQAEPYNYNLTLLRAFGTPTIQANASDQGRLNMALVQGSYALTPFVTSLNPTDPNLPTSLTELPTIQLDIGCKQKLVGTTDLICGLDDLPDCVQDPVLTVTGGIDNVSEQALTDSVSYELNGGPAIDVCPGCPQLDPAYNFDVTLTECDGVFENNTVAVSATDDAGGECTISDVVKFDGTAPVLSCSDIEVEGDPDLGGVVANYNVTATDTCEGNVPTNCIPPSGSFFPEGTTVVSCTAGDECGNQGQCMFDLSVLVCQDPDPRTQGYWHRQCLGMPVNDPQCPGIDPGRSGRGPSEPNDPGFCPDYHDCAETQLEDLGFYGLETCEGMNAVPANDACEKATKQLTALILNVCSGRLTNGCEVDVAAEGCASTNVGDLIDEMAALIQGGNCPQARDCGEAVNEGGAVEGAGGSAPETPARLDPYRRVDPRPAAPASPRDRGVKDRGARKRSR